MDFEKSFVIPSSRTFKGFYVVQREKEKENIYALRHSKVNEMEIITKKHAQRRVLRRGKSGAKRRTFLASSLISARTGGS